MAKKISKRVEKKGPVTKIQSSKNAASIVWAASLAMGFLPGLVIYFFRENDRYVESQVKETLNWNITFFFGLFVGTITSIFMVGIVLIFFIVFAHLIFCLMGAISTSKGKDFRTPFAFRLLK